MDICFFSIVKNQARFLDFARNDIHLYFCADCSYNYCCFATFPTGKVEWKVIGNPKKVIENPKKYWQIYTHIYLYYIYYFFRCTAPFIKSFLSFDITCPLFAAAGRMSVKRKENTISGLNAVYYFGILWDFRQRKIWEISEKYGGQAAKVINCKAKPCNKNK